MNKKGILLIFLVVVIIGVVFLVTSNKKENVNPTNPKEVKKEAEEVIKQVIDPDITSDEFESSTGLTNADINIIVGKDSYLKTALSKNVMEKYKLSQYEKEQNEYADAVESVYLKNLNYTMGDTFTDEGGEITQVIEVVGFYYELYITDLMELQQKLYIDSGYDLTAEEGNVENDVAYYKAKVKAMQLIDPYISEYENYGEKKEFTVTYVNGKPKNDDEMLTLVLNLRGMTYPNMDFSKQENIDAQNARIEKYISNGYKTGIIKKGNLLD